MKVLANGLRLIVPGLVLFAAEPTSSEPVQTIADPSAPPPAIAQLRLPDGPLLGVSGNDDQATFLEIDQTSRHNDMVEVTLFQVFIHGIRMNDRVAAQMVVRERFDCNKRTEVLLGGQAFDAAGNLVLWLPEFPPDPIRPGATEDHVAKVVCDGVRLPPTNVVTGHAAAVRMAHEMIPR